MAADTSAKAEAGLLKLDCEKALARLAWRPALDFASGVKLTAEWYSRYYTGERDMRPVTDSQMGADYISQHFGIPAANAVNHGEQLAGLVKEKVRQWEKP